MPLVGALPALASLATSTTGTVLLPASVTSVFFHVSFFFGGSRVDFSMWLKKDTTPLALHQPRALTTQHPGSTSF